MGKVTVARTKDGAIRGIEIVDGGPDDTEEGSPVKAITFTEAAKRFMLHSMGMGIDNRGYIIERGSPTKRVLASDGKEIKIKEFAGFYMGQIIRSDLPSLISLADSMKGRRKSR